LLSDEEDAMTPLVAAIALWLSVTFDFPADGKFPNIEFVPHAKIATMRLAGTAGMQTTSDGTSPQSDGSDVIAIYAPSTETILLPENWTGKTAADLSVLVHEMVHHLQHVSNQKFACPEQRERLAFEAQNAWLKLFKTDLEAAFGIDSFTVWARSACIP
jgi:hypothetical protein